MAETILPQSPVTAISLWEPWASLMRAGSKRVETRSWYTAHRGPLLICASKKRNVLSLNLLHEPAFSRGIAPLVGRGEGLHFGMAVALVDLVDVVRTDLRPARWEHVFVGDELAFGDYSGRRYAWVTDNLRTFDPFPVRGAQGVFKVDVPSYLLAARTPVQEVDRG